ncbi:mite group 2 allergen-like Ixo r 2 [Ornithodoros turicata]|uniref:mite group 2 allergen-like Ixo r 2 n=1 Tax=Ornithodoros turicata TaxID=34597 RepID=UPI003139050E
MRSFALILVFVELVYSRHTQIEYCGTRSKATIEYVDINPCDDDPCVLKRGEPTHFSISVTPKVNSKTVTLDARYLVWWWFSLPVPDLETDLCKLISCPVVAGQTYKVSQHFTISSSIPRFSTTLTVKVIGDDGQIVCFTTDATI